MELKKILLIALLSISSCAHATLTECEKLEARNETLVLQNRKNFYCGIHLGNSRQDITDACNSLAIGRNFIAKLQLNDSYNELEFVFDANCRKQKNIRNFRGDVKLFQQSF